MSQFVYDNTALSYPKSDLTPLAPGANPDQYVVAADWNSLAQAVVDLRDTIRAGKYHGLAAQSSDPAPTVFTQTWLWVRSSDGQLIHKRPGGTSRELVDRNSSFIPDTTNTYNIGSSSFIWQNIYASVVDAGSLAKGGNQALDLSDLLGAGLISVRNFVPSGGTQTLGSAGAPWVSAFIDLISSKIISLTRDTGNQNYFLFGPGQSSPLAASNTARLRYNQTTQTIQMSVNGGAYADLGASGGAVLSSRTLLAGAGLTGGGDLSADRTFDVVANVDGSIVVNTNDIQIGVLATDAQHGNRGGGSIHSLVVAAGAAGFMSGTDKTKLDSVASSATNTPLSSTTPANVGTAAIGVGTTAARSDHVHDVTFTKINSVLATANADINVNSQKIVSAANPTNPQDVATKAYVDAAASGLHIKQSVKAISLTNVTASGLALTIDGVAINTVGFRVLLAGQTSAIDNGIYVAASGAWTRATDMAAASSASGAFAFVELGTVNSGTGWVCSTAVPNDVVGTNSLTFTQFSGAGTITAGAGLTKTGNTLDVVANADGSIVVAADDVKVGVLATDAQHGNRGGGGIHAVVIAAGAAGFMSGADKTKLDGHPTSVPATSRQIISGAGLTGGGDLSADRTLVVGANADGSIVVNADDIQVGILATDAQHGNRTGGSLHSLVVAAGAAGFMSGADKTKLDGLPSSVPATTRQIIAGAGLTGGGDLSADRTLNVVANADGSIVVAADDVKVGVLATDAQHGNRGGGALHANVVAAGASGFMTGADKTKLDGHPTSVPPTSRQIIAGTGLTGGGDLSADRTISMPNTGPGAGTIGSSETAIGTLTLDAQGRVTAAVVATALNLSASIRFSGVISPPQITSDRNDYNPTGLLGASTMRLTADSNPGNPRRITGLRSDDLADDSGRVMILKNVGSNDIIIRHEDTGSDPENRFSLSSSNHLTLRPGIQVWLLYDVTAQRWNAVASYGSAVTSVTPSTTESPIQIDTSNPMQPIVSFRGYGTALDFSRNGAIGRVANQNGVGIEYFTDADDPDLWTNSATGSGVIAFTSTGIDGCVFRMSTGTSGTSTAQFLRTATSNIIAKAQSVPIWYVRVFLKITTGIDAQTTLGAGIIDILSIGANGSASTTKYSAVVVGGAGTVNLVSTVSIDANSKVIEVWATGGHVFISVNGETPVQGGSDPGNLNTGVTRPGMIARNGSSAVNRSFDVDYMYIYSGVTRF